MFGFAFQYVNYECSPPGHKTMNDTCKQADIKGIPPGTWTARALKGRNRSTPGRRRAASCHDAAPQAHGYIRVTCGVAVLASPITTSASRRPPCDQRVLRCDLVNAVLTRRCQCSWR
jgi:hypothetical protein